MIDPTLPVKLKRLLIDGSNIYYPGVYQPGYIPEKFLTENIVSQVENLVTISEPFNNAIKTQEINITAKDPVAPQLNSFQMPLPVVDKPEISAEIKLVNINTAAEEEIVTLPNIGNTIAKNIINERESKIFLNLDDLKERIPLKKGSWSALTQRIEF